MIRVEVRLHASLERIRPGLKAGEALPLELKEGTTVERMVEALDIPKKGIHLVVVNGRTRPLDHPVSDGDRVALFPPVGGG
ncbi:MoaD/ThiS family protein [Candidatus Bipolaricaulota bacterium]|nr:MoaD/ThiS family protein [Candidatus Bipolaricaulota bacterium]